MSEMAAAVQLTHYEASQLTERIKLKIGTIQDNIEALAALVTRAKDGGADVVLGFKSWTAYIVAVVGSDPLDLTRTERKKLVGFLAAEGMSTRAIAPVVGADNKTVHNDLQAQRDGATVEKFHSSARPAKVTSLDGRERPATQPLRPTGEVLDSPAAAPVERRRPLADGFRDAMLDLAKLITRIENLVADDRYPKNRNEVARYANDLIRARDALQRAINQMS